VPVVSELQKKIIIILDNKKNSLYRPNGWLIIGKVGYAKLSHSCGVALINIFIKEV